MSFTCVKAEVIKSWVVMGRLKVVMIHQGRHQVGFDSKGLIQCFGSSYIVMARHKVSFVVLGRHGSS